MGDLTEHPDVLENLVALELLEHQAQLLDQLVLLDDPVSTVPLVPLDSKEPMDSMELQVLTEHQELLDSVVNLDSTEHLVLMVNPDLLVTLVVQDSPENADQQDQPDR